MLAIVRKELADCFNSVRFFILFLLVLVASGLEPIRRPAGHPHYPGAEPMRLPIAVLFFWPCSRPTCTVSQDMVAILTPFSLLVPIIGIALGFDAINSERTGGTMSRLLAQPVYRDGVINGKFLAGLIVLAMMVGTSLLLMAGFGIKNDWRGAHGRGNHPAIYLLCCYRGLRGFLDGSGDAVFGSFPPGRRLSAGSARPFYHIIQLDVYGAISRASQYFSANRRSNAKLANRDYAVEALSRLFIPGGIPCLA